MEKEQREEKREGHDKDKAKDKDKTKDAKEPKVEPKADKAEKDYVAAWGQSKYMGGWNMVLMCVE